MGVERIVPSQHQPALPQNRFIVSDTPDAEAVPMDVVFVGGGPAGLAGAIELAKLQSEAPPMGGAFVRRRMASELGPDWRAKFAEFDLNLALNFNRIMCDL